MKRKHGIFVEFFAARLCTLRRAWPSQRPQAQASVVPVFMLRQPDGRHRVKLFPPLLPPADCAETILLHPELHPGDRRSHPQLSRTMDLAAPAAGAPSRRKNRLNDEGGSPAAWKFQPVKACPCVLAISCSLCSIRDVAARDAATARSACSSRSNSKSRSAAAARRRTPAGSRPAGNA